jgi:hypothetical protein
MRSGIGRAATMPKARAEVATKMVENCILNLVVVVGRVENRSLCCEESGCSGKECELEAERTVVGCSSCIELMSCV